MGLKWVCHYLQFTDEETEPNHFPEAIQLVNGGARIQTLDHLSSVTLTLAP